MNVQNASITNDDPAFWDENSGAGCMSSGCPSQAEANYVGTIPSESFTLLGNNDPAPQCFKSQDNLQIISNFTQMQAGTSGQNGVRDRPGMSMEPFLTAAATAPGSLLSSATAPAGSSIRCTTSREAAAAVSRPG